MSAQAEMTKTYSELQKEIKIISKWFYKTHGGPDIAGKDIAGKDAAAQTLAVVTDAMCAWRESVGKRMLEIEKFAEVNRIELEGSENDV